MLLWEDAERFRELSGEDPEETSIARISGFLDGYEKGKACTQSCTESQCESVQEIEGKQMDRYGYIGIETLLNFCENSKDHAITQNDFMRMKRVRMPSAEPEIVRCKDCIHWQDIDDGRQKHRMCAEMSGDWFCADGERRTDESD